MKNLKNLANFLFEIGTLRKIPRAHRQTLLTSDVTDNISSHEFRVAWIGWILSKKEKVDSYKVVMMCLLHDLPESRSNDQNWIHKKYVKVFEDEIIKAQLSSITNGSELLELSSEYEKRESPEAMLAKDADLIDQILLLKEHAHTGNKEAEMWLHLDDFKNKCVPYLGLQSEAAKKLAIEIINTGVSDWWANSWTKERK